MKPFHHLENHSVNFSNPFLVFVSVGLYFVSNFTFLPRLFTSCKQVNNSELLEEIELFVLTMLFVNLLPCLTAIFR